MFSAPIYYIYGAFLLRIRDGSIWVFCKIDTISKKINLLSVYSWHRRQVGLYNKRVPHGEFSSVRFYRAMQYSANRDVEVACRLSVCNGAGLGAHRLEILKTNCTIALRIAQRAKANKRRLKIMEKTCTETANIYAVLPIISGTLKAMNFKFGRNICRLTPSKRP